MNREEWLTQVAKGLEPLFKAKGFPLRKYRLTCGWPVRFATSRRQLRIGECHSIEHSKDGTSEIFITPLLDEPAIVAGVIAHELIHAAVGVKEGHGGKFVTACRVLGMRGKPKQAEPGKELGKRLEGILARLGPYPHAALGAVACTPAPRKDVRLVCRCGCKVTISLKWLERSGPPKCGCGRTMEPREKERD